jgi:hypothetical protein
MSFFKYSLLMFETCSYPLKSSFVTSDMESNNLQ